MRRSLLLALAVPLLATSCAPAEPSERVGVLESNLTAAERRARLTQIRDAAAAAGLTNGVLLAGIAENETGLAHCWSEAMWACEGPPSTDCGGGPVIAGAGDGPCEDREGGLGMFQFDAGTYDETLAREGERVLLVAGNVEAAIDFAVSMVVRSSYIDGVDTREQAIAWMNAVVVGGAGHEAWIQTVVRYYNGCIPGVCSNHPQRIANYDEALRDVWDEMGAAFWSGAMPPECAAIDAEGRIVDDVDPCVFFGGDLRFWRTASDAGYGGSLRWTNATASAAPANYAIWRLRFDAPGEYELLVHTDATYSESRLAPYTVVARDGPSEVIVDQTLAAVQTLGRYEFDADTDYEVRVDDDSGEQVSDMLAIVADALEVRPIAVVAPDAGAGDPDDRDASVGADAGVIVRTRAGASCSCRAVGANSPGFPALSLGTLALVALAWRRR